MITPPTLKWSITVTVPYDHKWSKNRMWLNRKHHGKRLAPHARSRRDGLMYAFQEQLFKQKPPIVHNKLWFGYHVYIPDHCGDAINAMDLVADAIEKAVELDDRWYQMGSILWDVDKVNPRMDVWIGQEDVPNAQVCGKCGKVLPFDAFTKGGSNCGLGSACRLCMKLHRKQAKKTKRL